MIQVAICFTALIVAALAIRHGNPERVRMRRLRANRADLRRAMNR